MTCAVVRSWGRIPVKGIIQAPQSDLDTSTLEQLALGHQRRRKVFDVLPVNDSSSGINPRWQRRNRSGSPVLELVDQVVVKIVQEP